MKSAFAVDVDDQLITRAQQGDREALFDLYNCFERPAYSLAFRLCQCQDEAQDVLQEGMLQLVEKIGQYRFEAPFWAWTRKLFINTCLMHLRNRRKQSNVEVLVDDQAVGASASPDTQRDIALAFARLAPERRAVLWLYAVEGYTHQEIANALGYSASYSKMQLMRARRQVKQWWRVQSQDDGQVSDYYDEQ